MADNNWSFTFDCSLAEMTQATCLVQFPAKWTWPLHGSCCYHIDTEKPAGARGFSLGMRIRSGLSAPSNTWPWMGKWLNLFQTEFMSVWRVLYRMKEGACENTAFRCPPPPTHTHTPESRRNTVNTILVSLNFVTGSQFSPELSPHSWAQHTKLRTPLSWATTTAISMHFPVVSS